jgi:hypothetical protein
MRVEILDAKHHPSPLTQGGLEVKSLVTVEWGTSDKVKFFILKTYIQNNYDFETSNIDDSNLIVAKLKKEIDSYGAGHSDSENEDQMDFDDPPIFMEPEF